MSSDLDLTGRVAVVTGATGGMGRAITRRLARAGAAVIASDLTDADAESLLAACRADPPSDATSDSTSAGGSSAGSGRAPGPVTFVAADVADGAQVAALVAAAVDAHGRLDCAVNAAAIEFETVPLAECGDDDFDRMLAVNVRGVFLSMKHELRAMLEAGNGGSIVNIASTNSFKPQHDQPAYTASKHAVLGLTRSAALDYARRGIRVNAICPGAIDTPMLRNAMERRGRQVEDVAARLSLFRRFGDPDEIADAALWLCSDASSFTTGHALAVDGGMLTA